MTNVVPLPARITPPIDEFAEPPIVFWEASEEWTPTGPRPSRIRHMVATRERKIVAHVLLLPPEERSEGLFWWSVPGWEEGVEESRDDAKEAVVDALRRQRDALNEFEEG